MNPVRLSRRGSAFDQRLVSAARAEVPAEGAEDRALALLGLPGLLVPAVVATSALPASSLVRVWALKGIAVLATVLAGVAVAFLVARPPAAPASSGHPVSVIATAAPRPAIPAPGPPELSISTDRPAPERAPVVASSPSPAPAPAPSPRPSIRASAIRPPNVPRAPASASPSAADAGTLSDEVGLVQEATQSLARRDPDTALSLLARYAARYPHGTLAAEASYVRVQSLLARGDRGAAMDLARHLVAADPHGVLSPKLEALIASEPVP